MARVVVLLAALSSIYTTQAAEFMNMIVTSGPITQFGCTLAIPENINTGTIISSAVEKPGFGIQHVGSMVFNSIRNEKLHDWKLFPMEFNGRFTEKWDEPSPGDHITQSIEQFGQTGEWLSWVSFKTPVGKDVEKKLKRTISPVPSFPTHPKSKSLRHHGSKFWSDFTVAQFEVNIVSDPPAGFTIEWTDILIEARTMDTSWCRRLPSNIVHSAGANLTIGDYKACVKNGIASCEIDTIRVEWP